MNNLGQLMQLGQQLQSRMSKLQENLESHEVTTSAGGGMVTVRADGKGTVKAIRIDPTCVDPADVEMLEDLVLAAVSEAQQQARAVQEEEMRKATGGLPMNLPGLPGLF
ncbi:MAG: YbaB/EbfC family nucleoid-associated protein [Gemmatimonadota bacterium]|nr:YbaB/EbfC family nucleoid-associated protein [Gemmatimonadota bacterium]MDH5760910.1 YbaB/EbfC family nucleoid-associated protein [Gemmatimonadota bacterium]